MHRNRVIDRMKQRYRLTIQCIAVMLQNANFKGFFTGKIWQGQSKRVCVPGLNCYSCPGAVGACPIGSLQNTLSGYTFRFPYYVAGLMIFFGAILGRAVCGFLCPFGLIQDLIHKIPFPKKIKIFRFDRHLRKLKYVVLILMVIVLPVCVKLTPFFCKYLCPSGTLAGILLALSDSELFQAVGALFTWKVCVLAAVLFLSILIYRPFCKYLCPLGAFYAPFNRAAIVQMKIDASLCVHCGRCAEVCGMGVNPELTPNSTECIRCGKCIAECPVSAIRFENTFAAMKENRRTDSPKRKAADKV